ncbi:hypothetical protein HDU81_011372 [Chytriomyces hyalinus]|nr:hypothetical protein HDU81_011372 [Chytriomyces hyalinus]
MKSLLCCDSDLCLAILVVVRKIPVSKLRDAENLLFSAAPACEMASSTTGLRVDDLYQGFQETELFIIGAFVGAPLEVCLGALLLKWTRPKKPRQSKWQAAPILLDLVNFFGAAYQISNLIVLFLDGTACVPFYIFNNITSHLFFICSDIFFLYITYLMSDFSSWVLGFSIMLTFNRIGWGLADVVYSGGLYVLDDGACIYSQNVTTGTAYPLSDMFVDLFSTAVMVHIVINKLRVQSQFSFNLICRNGIRSATITVISIFAMYAITVWESQFYLTLMYNAQVYVVARCVNYDILFDEQLGIRLNQKSKALIAVDKARLTLTEARRAGRRTLDVILTSPRHPY